MSILYVSVYQMTIVLYHKHYGVPASSRNYNQPASDVSLHRVIYYKVSRTDWVDFFWVTS